jgi:nitronate monooxygenase
MSIPAQLQGKLALPVMAAPMHLVSSVDSVVAQCCSGMVGSFPSLNARPQEQLAAWIAAIKSRVGAYAQLHPEKLIAPFAVTIPNHGGNRRARQDMAVCLAQRTPIIITSHAPCAWLSKQVHAYRGLVLHEVSSTKEAEWALASGIDGLVLVPGDGAQRPVAGYPAELVREVRAFHTGLLVLTGAAGTGSSVLAAQAIGCDMIYMDGRAAPGTASGLPALAEQYTAAKEALRHSLLCA